MKTKSNGIGRQILLGVMMMMMMMLLSLMKALY